MGYGHRPERMVAMYTGPMITEMGLSDHELRFILKEFRKLVALNQLLDERNSEPPFLELCCFLEDMMPPFARINKEIEDENECSSQKDLLAKYITSPVLTAERAYEMLLGRSLERPEWP